MACNLLLVLRLWMNVVRCTGVHTDTGHLIRTDGHINNDFFNFEVWSQ